MRSSARLPLLIVSLTLIWALLWADFSLANLVAGLAVAVAVVVIAAPTGVTPVQRVTIRPVSALVFVTYFLFQLVKSNLVVAWEIITPGSRLKRAIIAVPLHIATEGLVTLVGNSVTLTPGTLTIDVREADPMAGTPAILYIHVLQVGNVETARASVLRLERLAVKAFGTRDQLAALDVATANPGTGEEAAS
jgi:multicomponent Na+:H+ antiporter subunit E